MKMADLLAEFRAHDVELEPDGLKLRTPIWPETVPKDLRQKFHHHRRALFSSVASPVCIRLLTRSLCDAAATGWQRAMHESTQIVLLLALVDDAVKIWLPLLESGFEDQILQRITAQLPGVEAIACEVITGRSLPQSVRRAAKSGCRFGGYNCNEDDVHIWRAQKFPAPDQWVDLRWLARASGLPVDLKSLAMHLLSFHQADTDTDLIQRKLCQPDEQGQYRDLPMSEWVRLVRGEVSQLLLIADLIDQLTTHDEPDLLAADCAINSRGVGVDVTLARALVDLNRSQRSKSLEELESVTDGAVTGSQIYDVDFVLEWLRKRWIELPNLHAETIEWLLGTTRDAGVQFPPAVQAVLDARLSLTQHPVGELDRILAQVDDDNRLRHHLFYYATPCGRWGGRGFQLQRPPALDLTVDMFTNLDSLSTRLIGHEHADEVVKALAAACFVPSVGHQFCIARFVDIESQVLGWLVEQLSGDVREDRPQTVARFSEFEQVIQEMMAYHHQGVIAGLRFDWNMSTFSIRLPSGRTIYFRYLQSLKKDRSQETTVVVQAICRDLLAEALIRCEREGLPVVLHVHDEIVIEVSERNSQDGLSQLLEIMSRPPDWAAGLRGEAEGFLAPRYLRSPLPGGQAMKAVDGAIVT